MPLPTLVAIDDDEVLARRVADAARQLGFDASIASGMPDFMVDHDRHPPDVIVLELVLTALDGFGLIRSLHDRDTVPRLIVISGYSESYSRAAESFVQAQGKTSITCFTKPIDDDRLRAALRAALPAGRPGAS